MKISCDIKMNLFLYLWAIFYCTVKIDSCKSKTEPPIAPPPQIIIVNRTFWNVPDDQKAKWATWLQDFNNKRKKSAEENSIAGTGGLDSKLPDDFKGYGPGLGGVPPPPWAVFDGAYGKPDLCFQESHLGHCSQNLTRWGYNPYRQECQKFVYSGCGGNDNNFPSKARCDIACAVDVATDCQIFDEQ